MRSLPLHGTISTKSEELVAVASELLILIQMLPLSELPIAETRRPRASFLAFGFAYRPWSPVLAPALPTWVLQSPHHRRAQPPLCRGIC